MSDHELQAITDSAFIHALHADGLITTGQEKLCLTALGRVYPASAAVFVELWTT